MATPRRFAALVLLGSLWAPAGLAAAAEEPQTEEFRIENKVFLENGKEPHTESTTIFCRGVVYDYLKKPSEITVFDKARGRFVLLDLTRRVQTEVSMEKLAAFTDGLKRWAEEQQDAFVQFLADPKFDEQSDEATGELTFSSPWMTYRLTTVEAESPAVSRQYREFSDWYARLNTLITPGARPPFARLMVNAALEQRQRFPSEAQLTIRLRKGIPPKRTTVRSEHQLVRRLVESDRDRVAQAGQFMAIFKSVDFKEYQEKVSE